MFLSVLSGLLAALTQSMSYFFSRGYVQKRPNAAIHPGTQLLVISHVIIALLSVPVLGVMFPYGATLAWGKLASWLVVGVFAGLIGQIGLMTAMKLIEPSRAGPLFTVKLFIPAALTALFGSPTGTSHLPMTGWQWLAVFLCVIACFSLSVSGKRLTWFALGSVLFTVSFFSCSDWSVGMMVKILHEGTAGDGGAGVSVLRASLATVGLLYVATGVVAGLLLIPFGSRKTSDWRDALGFGSTWFVAMLFLFFAFGSCGMVLGTILQCTRSFMSILLGIGIMYAGYHHLETHQPWGVLMRRLGAGVLMFAGITLYLVRDPLHPQAGNTEPVKAVVKAPAVDRG